MLGHRDRQSSLLSAKTQLGEKSVSRMGVYSRLSDESFRLFCDEDFGFAYNRETGRPSCPPSLLATARLLQHYVGISDAEVVERCRYDLRWKVALDLDLASTRAPFSKSTFQLFRTRLTLHEQEGLVFERSVAKAREAGLLPKSLRVALDSSPVRGRGAVKDTYNLLSDAIVGVVHAVASSHASSPEETARQAGLQRHLEAASIKGSELVDWSDPGAVSSFLGDLIGDCEQALKLAETAAVTTPEVALLRKLLEQDIDPGDDESPPTIRRGVAKDRVVSVKDPEMRHGRKSSGSQYDGHKAHVAVDTESQVITAVTTTAPGESDGAQVKGLLEETLRTTGQEISSALGDCAYSSRKALIQAEEIGVDLKTRMPSSSKVGLFGASDFEVSEAGRMARCPAGHKSQSQGKRKTQAGAGIQHRWAEALCSVCPLKEQCTKAKRRTLYVPPDFHERRRREAHARSPQGLEELRLRIVVEHAIARLKNLGAGTARYVGRAKTRAQWLWCAAIANLTLTWSALEAR